MSWVWYVDATTVTQLRTEGCSRLHMTSSGTLQQLSRSQQLLPESWQPRQSPVSWELRFKALGCPPRVRPVPPPAGRPGADCLASAGGSANVTFFRGSRDLVLAPPRHRSKAMTPRLHGPPPLANQADLVLNSCDMHHSSSGGSLNQSVFVDAQVLFMKPRF